MVHVKGYAPLRSIAGSSPTLCHSSSSCNLTRSIVTTFFLQYSTMKGQLVDRQLVVMNWSLWSLVDILWLVAVEHMSS